MATSACAPRDDHDPGPASEERAPAATQPLPEVDRALIGLAWEALAAIEIGDRTRAQDAIERTAELSEGERQRIAIEAARSLEAGEVHHSEHLVQRFLSLADPHLTDAVVQLQLALFAARIGRMQSMDEHLHHAVDSAVPPDAVFVDAIDRILQAADGGEWFEAERRLSDLYGTALEEATGGRACAGVPRHRGEDLRIQFVVDHAWLGHQTGTPAVALAGLVAAVRTYLSDLGVRVTVVGVRAWESPAANSLVGLGDAALQSHPVEDDHDLLLVLTGKWFPGHVDGAFSRASRIAVVLHGFMDHEKDALLAAHEIGHFLGLTDLDGTFMQSPGFPLAPVWSPCQRAAVASGRGEPR